MPIKSTFSKKWYQRYHNLVGGKEKANEIVTKQEIGTASEAVSSLINQARVRVAAKINSEMVVLYRSIGKTITDIVLHGEKPEYGGNAIAEISQRLSLKYGKGFDKSSIHRMVKLYQEFPGEGLILSWSQKLSWTHLIALIPIEDDLKREFYGTLCAKEGWSVRTVIGRTRFSDLGQTGFTSTTKQQTNKTVPTWAVFLHLEPRT